MGKKKTTNATAAKAKRQPKVYPTLLDNKDEIVAALNNHKKDMGRKAVTIFIANIGNAPYRIRVAADSDPAATKELAQKLDAITDGKIDAAYLVHTQGGKGAGLKLDFNIKKLYVYVRPIKTKEQNETQDNA